MFDEIMKYILLLLLEVDIGIDITDTAYHMPNKSLEVFSKVNDN